MLRRISPSLLLAAAVVSSLCAVAQVTITPQGYATSSGYAVVPAPVSPPLLVTPLIHLATPRPSTGATNATPGTQAGATSFPSALSANPSAPQIVPTIEGTAPVLMMNLPQPSGAMQAQALAAEEAQNQAAVTAPSNITASSAQNQAQPVSAAAAFDFGVAPIASLGHETDGRSIAEAAAEYRRSHAQQPVHSYTNEDIERLNQQAGARSGEANGAVTNSGPSATPSGNPPATAQPNAAPANQEKPSPQINTPGTPARRPAPPPSQAVPQPKPKAMQNPSQAQSIAPAQHQASKQPRAQASVGPRAKLSNSPSSLPVVALLGFAAAAVGLISRT